MPGVGKTSIGRGLAAALRFQFIDTDIELKKRAGSDLQKAIKEMGRDYFTQMESHVLVEASSAESSIISTGGSAVYAKDGMRAMQEKTTVLYLKDSVQNIRKRIVNLETRGIVGLKDGDLNALYEERKPLYEQYADIIFELPVPFHKTRIIDTLLSQLHGNNII